MKTYKGYILKHVPACPTLISVAVEGRGGKIPKALEGSFTSYGLIYELIDSYLATKQDEQEGATDERKTRSKG